MDQHSPLKERVFTLRPAAPWYTERIKTEKTIRRRLLLFISFLFDTQKCTLGRRASATSNRSFSNPASELLWYLWGQPTNSRRGYPQKPRSNGKENPKYPCKECGKGVRSNQDALLCTECNVWSHAYCINLSKAGFKYYLDYPDIEWTCSLWSLPFRFEQSLVGVENLTQHGGEDEYASWDVAGCANDLAEPWIIQERKRNTTDLMKVHQ